MEYKLDDRKVEKLLFYASAGLGGLGKRVVLKAV